SNLLVEAEPEEGAEGKPVQPEAEPWYLANKYRTQEDAEKGYKELERGFHEKAQKAAELERQLEAIRQQTLPQQPPQPQITPEQLQEQFWQNPVEFVEKRAEQRAQQLLQPLISHVAELHMKEKEREYPDAANMRDKITRTMQDLTQGNVDLYDAARLIEVGKRVEELRIQAKAEGTQEAYAMQQAKLAAQPPSGKAQPMKPAVSIPDAEDRIRKEWGISEEDWLKNRDQEEE
ncbi:MAG: hypothetical protein Q6361_03030, partial [Candidatus Hermodarchaeota archaeon]|nr:hypothetical protein [Candidatus Hermodarchaeota archaeon]